MFRRRDDVWEARVADLKEAHAEERRALNKVIESLAEQIEYLRVTLGRPYVPNQKPAPGLAWPEFEIGQLTTDAPERAFLSEEEEDVIALHEFGHISEDELAARLQSIANQNH